MNIDVRTLYIASAATCFTVAAALFVFGIGRLRREGTSQWALGWAFQGICWILLALRGIIWDFPSIVIANSLLTASYPLFYAAVRQFQGRPYHRSWLFVPPVATFIFVLYFSVYTDNLSYRVMFVSAVATLQTGALAWVLFHDAPIQEKRAYWLTGVAFLITFLIWLNRLAEGLALPYRELTVFAITALRIESIIATFGIAILSSLGFVLMIRGRTERELRESEERFHTLSDAALEGIGVSEHGRILDANDQLLQIMGGTRDELIGQEVAAFVAPEDRERVMASIVGGLESYLEHRMLRRDGTPLIVETHGRTIPYQGRRVRITAIRDITEQKQAEEILQEYEKAVEGSTDMIAAVDREYRYRLANAAFLKYRGRSKEEVIGRSVEEIIGRDVFERVVKENLDKCFRDQVVHYEMRHTYPKLGERHLLVSYFPVRGFEGVDRVTTVIRDITEQKQAEEALRKAHDELETRVQERTTELKRQAELLNLTHDAIIARHLDHRIFFWNRGAEELYGWTSEEARGKVTHDLLQSVLPESRPTIDEKLLLHGRWEGEVTHTARDGRKVIVASRQALRRDNDGKPIAVLSINSDITEQKRMDEERQRLALAVEHTSEAIFIMDSSFIIRYGNPAFIKATGYAWEELGGKDTKLLWGDPDLSDGLRKTIAAGYPWEGVYRFKTKEGAVYSARTSIASIKDASGAIAYFVVVGRDITEEQKLEAQLRQAQKMEAIGRLSGGIAHDFNNILAVMIGFTELVKEKLSRGSQEKHYLQMVMDAGLRGREVIRQMLTLSHLMPREKKPLQLSGIVNETLKFLRASIPSTVNIRSNIASESGPVLGDPVDMQQVLVNLCTNAAHAMRDKGGTLDIELSDYCVRSADAHDGGMEPGLYTRLVVRDTGVGIAPEIRDKIFDPYFTTKKIGEGTGLGLSTVMGIVKHVHGFISLESAPGKGSMFTVYLPQVGEKVMVNEVITAEPIPRGSERILYVDDEALVVLMSEGLLRDLGYEVTSKTSSREALQVFRNDPLRFDLVITDQTMPEVTGVEFAKEILAIRPDMPVILCTGYSYLVDDDSAKAAGIKGFVMKPLTEGEIARTIRQVLDS